MLGVGALGGILATKAAMTEHGISGTLIYNRDLFGARKMAQFAGHFTRVVESICQDVDQKLWQVEMLSESERYQMLVSWNDTRV